MKNQALFSSKDKSKQIKCPQLQFLFGVLRVNVRFEVHPVYKGQLFDFGEGFAISSVCYFLYSSIYVSGLVYV